eukprot:478001-Amorphochlora_amoeboformis.AAC.1
MRFLVIPSIDGSLLVLGIGINPDRADLGVVAPVSNLETPPFQSPFDSPFQSSLSPNRSRSKSRDPDPRSSSALVDLFTKRHGSCHCSRYGGPWKEPRSSSPSGDVDGHVSILVSTWTPQRLARVPTEEGLRNTH